MRARTGRQYSTFAVAAERGWAGRDGTGRGEEGRDPEERRQIDRLCARSKSARVTPRIPTISLSGSPLGLSLSPPPPPLSLSSSVPFPECETAARVRKKPTSARRRPLEQRETRARGPSETYAREEEKEEKAEKGGGG